MIADKQTNLLYLADTLPHKYISFFALFDEALNGCGVKYDLIPCTKDVWAVDYMPIQVTKEKFVQFVYKPDYLQKDKKWRESISDVDVICEQIGLDTIKSDIVLDGGNVIRASDKVILCDKVFRENPSIPERQLIKRLEELFEVDNIVLVPQQPHDDIGHADGMVRFLDDRTVLINSYAQEDKDFKYSLVTALHNAGLDWVEIPYNPYENKTYWQANGIYMNYLHMQGIVIVPVFGMKEDEVAIKQFEQLFTGHTIEVVYSNELAKEGGVLNCVTWNILK